MNQKCKLRWQQYALCGIMLCFMGCVNYPPSVAPITLPDCTWAYRNVTFEEICLTLPECVTIFGGFETPCNSLGGPFAILNANPNGDGELTWTSVNEKCSQQTMNGEIKRYTFNNDRDLLLTLYRTIDEVQTEIASGDIIQNVVGSMTIKIDNVSNTDNGEYITLVWDSPEYSGTTGFLNLHFVAEAKKVSISNNVKRVYIHNQFVQL